MAQIKLSRFSCNRCRQIMDVLGTGDTYPSGWMQVALRQTKPVDGAPATIDLCPECALNMMDFIHGDAKEVQELEARA